MPLDCFQRNTDYEAVGDETDVNMESNAFVTDAGSGIEARAMKNDVVRNMRNNP
ncbi:hypothetical protein KIN20_037423 [Parelaphostrongylus tenuis]|uniref:Uncharacterized protein n=1 Tax=Parelaphostrongylus tenuis TaxID=148309 RepID=A0AAD5RDX7_PARTN|nr:hypothetical protein KIN20_037423 [Parelaphostrongylus tenuis]